MPSLEQGMPSISDHTTGPPKAARVEGKLDNILVLLQTGGAPATIVRESISSHPNSYIQTNSLDSPSDPSVREFSLTLAQAEEYLTTFKNQKFNYSLSKKRFVASG